MTNVQIRQASTLLLQGIASGMVRASPHVRDMAKNELARRAKGQ